MNFTVNFLIFFGVLFSLIIAAGAAVKKDKIAMDKYQMLAFFGLSLWILQIAIYSTSIIPYETVSYYISTTLIPVTMLVPPIIAMRYRWIIYNRIRIEKRYYFLFIPVLISIIILTLPLFNPEFRFKEGLFIKGPLLSENFKELPIYFKLVYLMFPLPKIYLIYTMIPNIMRLHTLSRNNSSRETLQVSRMGFLFGMAIILSNFISIYGDFYSFQTLKAGIILANFSLALLYIANNRFPDYNSLLARATKKAYYERSKIKGLDIDKITNRLYQLMNDEKIYSDEELSLKTLAAELDIKPHQLSQILNERIEKNFNTFVNEYRVDEAKKLLLEDPKRSILSIGFSAGFNSNTTFINAFTKIVGISPGQYRKKTVK